MGDIDTSKIVTVWGYADMRIGTTNPDVVALQKKGYAFIDQHSFDMGGHRYVYWLMAPPEPQEPTLAERLRSEIAYGINAELADDAAVALEHYDRLKEAVRVLSLTEPEASGKMPIRVDSDAFGLLLAILREAQ